MQKLHKSLCISVLLLVLVIAIILSARILKNSVERHHCICTLLTDENTIYPIDTRLDSIIDTSTLTPGTFVRINTSCRHNVHMNLTVYVDEGWYQGHVVE